MSKVLQESVLSLHKNVDVYMQLKKTNLNVDKNGKKKSDGE